MNWKIVTCEVALIASCMLLIFKGFDCWFVWTILGVTMVLPCVALGSEICKQKQKIKQENKRIKQQWELDRKFDNHEGKCINQQRELDRKFDNGVKLRKDFCEWMEWKKTQELSIGDINEEFNQFKKMFHSDAGKTE